jgi:hypothetical protein
MVLTVCTYDRKITEEQLYRITTTKNSLQHRSNTVGPHYNDFDICYISNDSVFL